MELPQRGFYIHYKHDPNGVPNNYTYEVTGIGRDTENKNLYVLYRPLYESDFMPPADVQCRPLEMFLENVEVNGVSMPRFARVIDPTLIAELEAASRRMYKA